MNALIKHDMVENVISYFNYIKEASWFRVKAQIGRFENVGLIFYHE